MNLKKNFHKTIKELQKEILNIYTQTVTGSTLLYEHRISNLHWFTTDQPNSESPKMRLSPNRVQ
jgi:hypothetical protein